MSFKRRLLVFFLCSSSSKGLRSPTHCSSSSKGLRSPTHQVLKSSSSLPPPLALFRHPTTLTIPAPRYSSLLPSPIPSLPSNPPGLTLTPGGRPDRRRTPGTSCQISLSLNSIQGWSKQNNINHCLFLERKLL